MPPQHEYRRKTSTDGERCDPLQPLAYRQKMSVPGDAVGLQQGGAVFQCCRGGCIDQIKQMAGVAGVGVQPGGVNPPALAGHQPATGVKGVTGVRCGVGVQ